MAPSPSYRLDFEEFTVQGPSNSLEYDYDETTSMPTFNDANTGGGKCADDLVTITAPASAGVTVPTICGKNTGQHSKMHIVTQFPFLNSYYIFYIFLNVGIL